MRLTKVGDLKNSKDKDGGLYVEVEFVDAIGHHRATVRWSKDELATAYRWHQEAKMSIGTEVPVGST